MFLIFNHIIFLNLLHFCVFKTFILLNGKPAVALIQYRLSRDFKILSRKALQMTYKSKFMI